MKTPKLIAAAAAVAVVAGSLLAVSTGILSASAHTGDLFVSASCQTDGTYTLTATLKIAATTEDGDSVWKVGDSNFAGTPQKTDAPFTVDAAHPKIHSTNNPSTITLGSFTLPGTTTGFGPWVYSQSIFIGDNYFVGSDGQLTTALKGDCKAPTPKDAVVSAGHVGSTCDATGAYTEGNFGITNATWTDAIDNTVGTHTRHATAAADHLFTNGTNADSVTYTVDATLKVQKDISCYPSVTCVVNSAAPGIGQTGSNESGDLLPSQGVDGLVFNGPTAVGQAMDTYGRVLGGNAQGITSMSVTYSGTSTGFPAQVVEEILRDGVGQFATLSTNFSAAEATGTVNLLTYGGWYTSKIASGPGSLAWVSTAHTETYAQLIANFPANVLLSTPSLHLQTNSGADSHSVVASLSSNCQTLSFVPVIPEPKLTTSELCSTDNDGQGVVSHFSTAAIFVNGAYTFDGATPVLTGTTPAPAGDCAIAFSTCETQTTLPTATELDSKGWGDLLHGTWVQGGIDLKATSTEEAYAYLDLDAAHQFKFSDIGSLATNATSVHGNSAIIMQATGGQNIHVEADGEYWTIHPGLFPETSPGMYSTYHPETAGQTFSNPTVTEVAVWVNPGNEVVLHAQSYNCQTQPFTHTDPPVVVVITKLAETGSVVAPWFVGAWIAAILAGAALLVYRRRLAQRG